MVLGRYLECDVRVDTPVKIAGEERKKKKEERKTKRCLQRKETVAPVGKRPRLLTWEGVWERRSFVSKVRGFCRDRRYPTWASGERRNSAKENIRR